MFCENCGAKVAGNFCSACGTPAGGGLCPKCGHRPEAGASFCNECGTKMAIAEDSPTARASDQPTARASDQPTARGTATEGSKVAWWISGALLIGLILVVAWPVIRGGNAPPQPQPQQPLGASSVDLNSMTPRQAADALFDRVMRAASAGDAGEIAQFLPMAIAAYERAEPLDADGRFHLALLLFQGSSFAESLAAAEEVLADDANHLLALSAAAEAAAEMGDSATARAHFTHLLDIWNSEVARDLPEYQAHQGLLSQIEASAEEFLGSGG